MQRTEDATCNTQKNKAKNKGAYLRLQENISILNTVKLQIGLNSNLHMTKCHSIRHQTPKFPTPQKIYATIFFGLLRTLFWSN